MKGIDTEECLEVCVWLVGVLCMPDPALILTIVFILCNPTELQSDEFKLRHLHAHCELGVITGNRGCLVDGCRYGIAVLSSYCKKKRTLCAK